MALVLLLAVVGAGCASGSPHAGGARTFYESLDLATPSAAVETFTDAFARKDFMTVWLAFDRGTQQILGSDFDLLQWRNVIDIDALPDPGREISAALSFDNLETRDRWYIFDQVMMIADRNDAYLIDLTGDVTVGQTSPVGDGVEVATEVEGIDGEVRFRLLESPSGRWRVFQVIVPDGDEARVPWSVPPG